MGLGRRWMLVGVGVPAGLTKVCILNFGDPFFFWRVLSVPRLSSFMSLVPTHGHLDLTSIDF